jgi:hypothetical protein
VKKEAYLGTMVLMCRLVGWRSSTSRLLLLMIEKKTELVSSIARRNKRPTFRPSFGRLPPVDPPSRDGH